MDVSVPAVGAEYRRQGQYFPSRQSVAGLADGIGGNRRVRGYRADAGQLALSPVIPGSSWQAPDPHHICGGGRAVARLLNWNTVPGSRAPVVTTHRTIQPAQNRYGRRVQERWTQVLDATEEVPLMMLSNRSHCLSMGWDCFRSA